MSADGYDENVALFSVRLVARAVSGDEICVVENGGQTLLAGAHLACFDSQNLETEWESFEMVPAASVCSVRFEDTFLLCRLCTSCVCALDAVATFGMGLMIPPSGFRPMKDSVQVVAYLQPLVSVQLRAEEGLLFCFFFFFFFFFPFCLFFLSFFFTKSTCNVSQNPAVFM